ncbi:UDP-glucuronosyl/UDP-glucosyltransferase [Artemisia annua]|uniref:Glycosyltransferase n=1 Tax=Artemisia annua TaxID=35608 RepID=A0A2U1KZ95_ARTAN|nr:UDP-glucuronosyl/UDP-glucosyltransferase [Artemisia annua]
MDQERLHIAIITSPGVGHLIPVLQLGNRLANNHYLQVTVLAVTTQTSPIESQLVSTLNDANNINIIKIPLPDISSLLQPNDTIVTHLAIMMREARQGIRSAISAMTPHPHVLIVDLFSSESLPIAEEFQMQKYVYVPCSARFLALTTYLHVLDKKVIGQYVEQIEPLKIPGCEPVHCEDVPDPMLDRTKRQYDEYVRMGIDFTTLSDGILLNTWTDMDSTSLDALKYNEDLRAVVKVPVYDIGPLTREVDPASSEGDNVMEWLDMQSCDSVLFVSFGSGGTLSAHQITELAWGLELSKQRFVWVVRSPAGSATDGSFFTGGTDQDRPVPDFLPEGYLTRTKKFGLVVPSWAPQVKILNHPSVGGFLSHCGLNSVYESIKGGVPMISWPLYAEQRMNATILVEELGVAIRPAVLPVKKTVEREEIEMMVRSLMEGVEGNTMRERVKELRESAKEALGINGSSYKSMCEFIRSCGMKN